MHVIRMYMYMYGFLYVCMRVRTCMYICLCAHVYSMQACMQKPGKRVLLERLVRLERIPKPAGTPHKS